MRLRYPSGLTNLTPNSVRLMKKELAKCPQSELARLERGRLSLKEKALDGTVDGLFSQEKTDDSRHLSHIY